MLISLQHATQGYTAASLSLRDAIGMMQTEWKTEIIYPKNDSNTQNKVVNGKHL